jgi:hypothetical protein
MLQAMAIQYQRGYDGKPMSRWIKRGTLSYKAYKEGESDRKKGLPHRYIKTD